jgi:phage repressor protein C with HTH and peptisase S24 domain
MDIEEIRRERLRQFAVEHQHDHATMARLLERSDSQISQLIGKTPSRSIGPKLAREFEGRLELPKYWLDERPPQVEQNSAEYRLALRNIPIVGKTQGGSGGNWEELGFPKGFGDGHIDAISRDPNAYALLVEGSSMAPRMREGEAILVEPNHQCVPGDEVVVKTVEREVMVKLFSAQRDGRVFLDSLSPGHESRVFQREELVFMHFVAGVFRAGAVKINPRNDPPGIDWATAVKGGFDSLV